MNLRISMSYINHTDIITGIENQFSEELIAYTNRESEITRSRIACPFCSSLRLQILSGKEFIIESLEVDIHGNQSSPSGDGME